MTIPISSAGGIAADFSTTAPAQDDQRASASTVTSAYTGRSTPATKLDKNNALADALRERVMPQTPIYIANRDDASGGGRDWDHKTIQALSGRETVAVASPRQRDLEIELANQYADSKGIPRKQFAWFNTRKLPFPVNQPGVNENGRSGEGLLVVPGGPTSMSREVLGQPGVPGSAHGEQGASLRYPPKTGRENSTRERANHQANLLRQARNTGQPTLGICGGSWHLAAAFGGNTVTSPEFEARHTADMPSLIPVARPNAEPAMGVAHGTIMQHPVTVEAGSLLADAMKLSGEGLDINANSVHWAEVLSKPGSHGETVAIAGTDPMSALQTDALLKVTARVRSDNPGEATIEGFEARHGAPVVGVQHHPEALAGIPTMLPGTVASSTFDNANYHHEREAAEALFDYMAAAGDAFSARRNMTRDFEAKVADGTLSNGDDNQFPRPSQLTGR
ncbi:gamma-glutamyl-gamma-aminobutyrate hydrolase family protein [Herbaspirillum sp. alder98]|uniref:gamma-glutamyl-gamma-aminobutyrate hydrolase family protein n=1 Tax=Herbaspirillum sp. alder98 TaxID=2913096 RepID=UPI001CD8BD04|nr:gamma-glutamyl-gamma-aminobutyrate hydrolase family protein [Herbaspirillum sp. alder98]MCA1325614.1 gamma-glutamyl-gamma-aminobutyrate hydrolase family protein [Herbaspirillum sp. alder98]